jgi:hypothetical protein
MKLEESLCDIYRRETALFPNCLVVFLGFVGTALRGVLRGGRGARPVGTNENGNIGCSVMMEPSEALVL